MALMVDLNAHVLDTGPLLCLGNSSNLREWYDDFLLDEGLVVTAVHGELKRQSNLHPVQWGSGNTEHRKLLISTAKRLLRHYSQTLFCSSRLIPEPSDYLGLLSQIQAELQSDSEHKAHRRGVRDIPSNEGEAFSIHAILTIIKGSVYFVSNDEGARGVARNHGIRVCTFVDLFRYICAQSRDSRQKKRVHRELLSCRMHFDIGGVISNPSDLDLRYFGT